jgi:hypothetical protein
MSQQGVFELVGKSRMMFMITRSGISELRWIRANVLETANLSL